MPQASDSVLSLFIFGFVKGQRYLLEHFRFLKNAYSLLKNLPQLVEHSSVYSGTMPFKKDYSLTPTDWYLDLWARKAYLYFPSSCSVEASQSALAVCVV